jgi:hypothetical protein
VRHDRDTERFFPFAMLACARPGFSRQSGTAEARAANLTELPGMPS